jgi:hypothetical protein
MRRRRPEAKWTHVASSAVRAVRYHSAQNKLDVRFEEGREYRYGNVPRSKFRALLEADSIGEFVNREIKPYHPCEEITSSPHRQSLGFPSASRNAN